jgi:signal transduction histidine kinase
MNHSESRKHLSTAERVTALSRVGAALMSELDEARLLHLIAETACDFTGTLFAAFLSIRDSGIGIPAQQQARIFGLFTRADNAQESGIGGTGLGLYLSRELIELHGGRLWFESTEGHGSTFFMVLPTASDAPPLVSDAPDSNEDALLPPREFPIQTFFGGG